ncbi:hypothetical protein KO507_01060 [Gilvimarinus agarilyticus]|uniref:tetratricopeptide repeat protein n=1 Tax=Gilvimarinus sp. 2_MG-2023 TaxID=3062666 RepID=UPI001C09F5B6|nr:hypothetical protein [Gilvimarinus sp. 2_MG-2023]MBU2884346.1 hypothetical protein [Gilvimarinus agarilyticus]MDO6569482.1 hypothetical protein [Gilvimarinus sp. 2_MG-2023]
MNAYEHSAQIARVCELLENGKAKAALKRLSPLYKADEDNLEVVYLVLDALAELELHDQTQTVILRAIKRQPQEAELWGRLVHFYLDQKDSEQALKVLNKASAALPEHYELSRLKAFVYSRQGNREAMHDQLEVLIAAHPEHTHDLLIERAELYRTLALEPKNGEAQVKDALGFSALAVVPLQKAAADITRAINHQVDDWHLYFKRAGFHKLLLDFDAAIVDYDQALRHLDTEGEDFREFLIQERDGCLNGGRNGREAFANSLREGMPSADNGELSMVDYMSNNLMDTLADQYTDNNGNIVELLETVSDDPDEALALSVAQDIIKQAREPNSDYQPVDACEFPRSERAFCDKVEKALTAQGFTSLGDFEPVGARPMLGKRALVRIFLSEDSSICAAAARFSPLKPALWVWLIMVLLRQWKPHHFVQLESVTTAGHFLITSNSGSVSPFTDLPRNIDALNMAPNTKLPELVAAHQERLQTEQADWVDYQNLDGVLDYQETLRLAKNAHRESIGFVTEDELNSLLGKQYDKFAEPVRKYLRLLTHR